MLVISFALRRFSLGTPVFPFSQKSTFLNYVDVLPLNHSFFISFLTIINLLRIFKTYRGDSESSNFNENLR